MLEYLKTYCYKDSILSDEEIQQRIDAVQRAEHERKIFALSIKTTSKKKK